MTSESPIDLMPQHCHPISNFHDEGEIFFLIVTF